MAGYEIKTLRPTMPRREQPLSLCVYTDNREALSYIPNPASFEEGGPVWSMTYATNLPWKHEITGLLDTLEFLLSPSYTAADAMKRLRELRAAYRAACNGEVPAPPSLGSIPPNPGQANPAAAEGPTEAAAGTNIQAERGGDA